MEKSVFTFFKKYKYIFLGVMLLTFLSGCQAASNQPLDMNSLSWFEHYFVYPFTLLIKAIAGFFNDNFGLSLIIITIVIRLILMPFMLKQMKSSMQMKDKMDVMKPEMDAIKKKYKDNKDADAQKEQQKELMQLYQKHNMNPLASLAGCLPLLIQTPILIGFYYAIRRTPEIATHGFLWFNLGQTDIILTIIAVVIYYFQFKVSQIGIDPKQRKQMAFMGIVSPLMIGFISFSAPAALPLYWATGGLFLIAQTLISKKMYKSQK